MFGGLDLAHWIMLALGLLFGLLLGNSGFRTTFFVKLRHFMTGMGKGADRENRRAQGLPPRETKEDKPKEKVKGKAKGGTHYHLHLPNPNGEDDDD